MLTDDAGLALGDVTAPAGQPEVTPGPAAAPAGQPSIAAGLLRFADSIPDFRKAVISSRDQGWSPDAPNPCLWRYIWCHEDGTVDVQINNVALSGGEQLE